MAVTPQTEKRKTANLRFKALIGGHIGRV